MHLGLNPLCDEPIRLSARYLILFISSFLKSLMILAMWLAVVGAIYSRITPIVPLNCTFFLANEKALLKHDNQSDFNACLKWPIKSQESQTIFETFTSWFSIRSIKCVCEDCICETEFCDFKMNVITEVVIEVRVAQFWSEIILRAR